jgi:hypothetical protein
VTCAVHCACTSFPPSPTTVQLCECLSGQLPDGLTITPGLAGFELKSCGKVGGETTRAATLPCSYVLVLNYQSESGQRSPSGTQPWLLTFFRPVFRCRCGAMHRSCRRRSRSAMCGCVGQPCCYPVDGLVLIARHAVVRRCTDLIGNRGIRLCIAFVSSLKLFYQENAAVPTLLLCRLLKLVGTLHTVGKVLKILEFQYSTSCHYLEIENWQLKTRLIGICGPHSQS